jgi:cytoskeleton protein RodZ
LEYLGNEQLNAGIAVTGAPLFMTSEATMTAVLTDISEGPAPEPVHNQDQDRPANKQGQSLGDLLRSTREALGMTRQQAAEHLRLLPHWIDAFEGNRFDSLVAPVYSRGYLRKYAILLELPPEEILARYERLHDIPATPPLAPIKPTASPPIRTSRAPAWLGATAFMSVAAVLVLTQMDQEPSQSGAEAEPQVANMSPVATAPAPVAPADTAPVSAPEAVVASADAAAIPVNNTEDGTLVPDAAAANTDAATIAPASGAESTLTPVSVQTPPAEPEAEAVPAEALVEPEEPLARLEVPMARGGRNLNIKLSFKGKSWTTVYAADGTRLLYELGRRGRPRTVSSPAPVTVVVGAIDAVEMRVNDKLIAIPRAPGKESIKFILDVEGATRDTRSAADVGAGG